MPKVIFILIFLFSSIAHADRTMLSNVGQSAPLFVIASWFTTGSNNPAENTVIPCAGSQCSYGVVLYYENGSVIDFNGRSIPVTAGMTWKMANDMFIRRFGATGIAMELATKPMGGLYRRNPCKFRCIRTREAFFNL